MELRKKVQELFDSEITTYQMAKATGITQPNIDRYRSGKGKIGNMKLEFAEKLAKYWEESDMKTIKATTGEMIEKLEELAQENNVEFENGDYKVGQNDDEQLVSIEEEIEAQEDDGADITQLKEWKNAGYVACFYTLQGVYCPLTKEDLLDKIKEVKRGF